jgi:hypothetical protein
VTDLGYSHNSSYSNRNFCCSWELSWVY